MMRYKISVACTKKTNGWPAYSALWNHKWKNNKKELKTKKTINTEDSKLSPRSMKAVSGEEDSLWWPPCGLRGRK